MRLHFCSRFLYIKWNFAKIKIIVFLVYSSIANYIFTFFPIFLTVSGYFDQKNKRLNFYVILYGCVKIIGGYIRFEKFNLMIHISKKKAFCFNLKNYRPSGNLKRFKSIELVEFNSLVSLKDEPKNYLIGAGVSNLQNTIFSNITLKKEFLKVNNKLNIGQSNENFVLFNFTILFNIFVIGNIIVKFLWSKL